MLKVIILLDQVVSLAAIATALIYSPLAKTWLRALFATFIIAIIASFLGIYETVLTPQKSQNILSSITFPIILLIAAVILRSIRLFVFPIQKPNKALHPTPFGRG